MQVLYGLVFSMVSLYMITVVLIVWNPEPVPIKTSEETDGHSRLSTAIVANSMMIGLAFLFMTARLCSWVGEELVKFIVSLMSVTANEAHSTGSGGRCTGTDLHNIAHFVVP